LPSLNIDQCASLKTLVVAGDTCPEHVARLWSTGRQFINAYGPSETTVCATMGLYDRNQSASCIGKPLHNIQIHVLNQHHEMVPVKTAGELHIGGVGLARGYLNRPDLTAEKFIPNPFHDATNPASSERLYKTGDLVRWLPDGNLEFLGRIDHQVKIRGFRIELGEIEHALTSSNWVRDAMVLARETDTGDKRLIAYVVADEQDGRVLHPQAGDVSDGPISEEIKTSRHEVIEGLRQELGKTLPDYMVPSAFVFLKSFPLTPNGKVDRK